MRTLEDIRRFYEERFRERKVLSHDRLKYHLDQLIDSTWQAKSVAGKILQTPKSTTHVTWLAGTELFTLIKVCLFATQDELSMRSDFELSESFRSCLDGLFEVLSDLESNQSATDDQRVIEMYVMLFISAALMRLALGGPRTRLEVTNAEELLDMITYPFSQEEKTLINSTHGSLFATQLSVVERLGLLNQAISKLTKR